MSSGKEKQVSTNINYRKLLYKYLNHVGCEEGITYVNRLRNTCSDEKFTLEEIGEMETIEDMRYGYVEG